MLFLTLSKTPDYEPFTLILSKREHVERTTAPLGFLLHTAVELIQIVFLQGQKDAAFGVAHMLALGLAIAATRRAVSRRARVAAPVYNPV